MRKYFFCIIILSSFFSCQSAHFGSNQRSKSEEHISALSAAQSEQMQRLSMLEENLRILNGKVEELQFALDNRVDRQISVIKNNLVGVERRLPLPSIVNKNTLVKDKIFAKESQDDNAKVLESALQNIEKANFKKANLILSESNEIINPKVKYRAVFWNALSLEALFEYNDAVKLYDSIVSNFPKTKHAEESLYRLGNVFSKMGRSKLADLTYKKLKSSYPKSEFIRK